MATPIVLLHGFPQTAAERSRLTPHLRERGYRAIARTLHGYSPRARPLRLPLGLNRPPSTARCPSSRAARDYFSGSAESCAGLPREAASEEAAAIVGRGLLCGGLAASARIR